MTCEYYLREEYGKAICIGYIHLQIDKNKIVIFISTSCLDAFKYSPVDKL